jgi:hypothetical protein
MPGMVAQRRGRRLRSVVPLLLTILALFAFVLYWWYAASGFALFATRAVPILAGSAAPVVPGIYILGGLDPSAGYVIETSQGLVLVDSRPGAADGPLKSEVTALVDVLEHHVGHHVKIGWLARTQMHVEEAVVVDIPNVGAHDQHHPVQSGLFGDVAKTRWALVRIEPRPFAGSPLAEMAADGVGERL